MAQQPLAQGYGDPRYPHASAPYPPQPAHAYPFPPAQAYPSQPPPPAYASLAGPQQVPLHGGYGQPGAPGGYGQGNAWGGQGEGSNMGYGRENPSYSGDRVPKASDDAEGAFAASFSDKAIRRGFIRKVYLILCAQLMVTFGFICLFIFTKPIKDWVQGPGFWFYIVAYVLFLVLYIALVCCPSVRRNSPGNFICLALFTLAFSYLAATISSFHDTDVVLIAAGITALLCLAISIFAIQTKIDFTMCAGLLFVLLMVLILFGFACMIVSLTSGPNRILSCVYGALGALVFGLFLVYDTQVVMGGKKYELSPEEYIYGALQLYVDVVQIFLFLLSLVGNSK